MEKILEFLKKNKQYFFAIDNNNQIQLREYYHSYLHGFNGGITGMNHFLYTSKVVDFEFNLSIDMLIQMVNENLIHLIEYPIPHGKNKGIWQLFKFHLFEFEKIEKIIDYLNIYDDCFFAVDSKNDVQLRRYLIESFCAKSLEDVGINHFLSYSNQIIDNITQIVSIDVLNKMFDNRLLLKQFVESKNDKFQLFKRELLKWEIVK